MRFLAARFAWILGLAVLPAIAGGSQDEPDPEVQVHVLLEGTPDATDWIEVDSGVPGPTVMIVGGVHGNEPAGFRAARQIAGWSPVRGRLVLVPRANQRALEADQRRSPGLPKLLADFNRQFPISATRSPTTPLAQALWRLVKQAEPDLLLDLNEGYEFTQIEPKSVGSSIIADPREQNLVLARSMLGALNPTITDPKKKFVLKKVPIEGSLARAAAERLDIPTMILETTTKDQALAFRARQHRILVHRALSEMGMIQHGPDRRIGTAADDDDLCVGVYVSSGVGGRGASRLEELLVPEHDFVLRQLCVADVLAGQLDEFDVLIFPGGSASAQARAIGENGREQVRQFLRDGGGYVGICAGAYLAANNYEWSLDVLDVDVIDRKHWARGVGEVEVRFTTDGLGALGAAEVATLHYANGPIYAPSGDPELPDAVVLGRFTSEVQKEGVPGGVMPDTPALVTARYGEGRVVCTSPHPELTDGLDALLRALVRLAARPELEPADRN